MMLLHFLSYPNPYIGYGVHALYLQRELAALAGQGGFQFHATDLGQADDLRRSRELIAAAPPDRPIVNLLLGDGRTSHRHLDLLPGRRITYTVFESDVLPLGWKENLQRSDLVITASAWGADILRRELGETPVAVVPEGVDPRLYHQWNRSTDSLPWQKDSREDAPLEQCFRFLSVGKFETRKSFEELIAAFRIAFPDRMDVRLLLRLHNVFQPDYRQRVDQLISSDIRNRVLIVGGAKGAEQLSPESMAHLYRSCHCFVYPTRAEGWGLPLIEAISCGTPFIATHHSGPMEYLRWCSQSFSDLAYTMVEITDPEYLRYHSFPPGQPGRWAQPDVNSLALQMRNAYENWPALREQAAINAKHIHRQFSWMAAAETLVDVIRSHLADAPGGGSTLRTSA